MQYEKSIEEIQNVPNFPTVNLKVNLNKLARENHILNVEYIQVSITELENGILDNYFTTILIIVGHGTPDGISDKNDEMAWDSVHDLIEDEKAELSIIASCFSEKATQELKSVYGFAEEIDFEVASFIALTMIFRAIGEKQLGDQYYSLALIRFLNVLSNPECGKNLGIGPMETEYWILYIIVNFVQLLVGIAFDPSGSFIQKVMQVALVNLGAMGFVGIINTFILFFLGSISFTTFVSTILGLLLDFVGYIWTAFSFQSFWFKALYYVLFAFELAAIAASGSGILWLRIVPWVTCAISIGVLMYLDKNDNNDIPCVF